MALAAECFVPQLGCEALFPVLGARVPHHQPSPHLPTSPNTPTKEYAVPKDYSIPLHVDCSVEYDLPDCAKPPQGVKIEPLLMIHPAHFRRLDSMRRCPFVNNLPNGNNNNNYSLPNIETTNPTNTATSANFSCQYQQMNNCSNTTNNSNVSKPTRSSAKSYLANKVNNKESPNLNLKNSVPNCLSNTNKRWRHLTSNINGQCCGINNSNNNNNTNKDPVSFYPGLSQANPSHVISNSQPIQYKAAEVPDQYWSSCGGAAGSATLLPFAPKEGDTLENSTFGKYPKYRSSRLRSHPYYPSLDANCPTPMLVASCDSNFSKFDSNTLQGNSVTNGISLQSTNLIANATNINNNMHSINNKNNSHLVSPFHAKMYSTNVSETNFYPSYHPLVMYK